MTVDVLYLVAAIGAIVAARHILTAAHADRPGQDPTVAGLRQAGDDAGPLVDRPSLGQVPVAPHQPATQAGTGHEPIPAPHTRRTVA